ncbi:hypothetical protein H4P12_06815 [Paracoccus sp. 11-3]|uniref:Uncharacterized protein n=1 Tax=Paracoccus amoyensis TaxID=2760093 RepID=A0A926JD22_9RHOB|nr:hypothetical protein [Paracoccus amoyensis]MBC9246428.1 hypothetical protein [Paracoccus amoyensis]
MTPRNVLLIGNSHTVAARIALQENPRRWPGYEFDVLALPPASFPKLAIQDDVLCPTSEDAQQHMQRHNGIPDLPLAGYDAFVVIGDPAFSAVAQLQNDARSFDFPSVQAEGAERLVSTAYMDAMIRTRIANSAALKIVRLLAGYGRGPVLLVDAALPSLDSRHDPEGLRHYIDMVARGDAVSFRKRYLRILTGVLAKHARLVPQPASTIVEDAFTAPEWMRGSFMLGPRQDRLHEEREYRHANPAYGALQLDAVVEALARS